MLSLKDTYPRLSGSLSNLPLLTQADMGNRLLAERIVLKVLDKFDCDWVCPCDYNTITYAATLVRVASMYIWGDSYIDTILDASPSDGVVLSIHWEEVDPVNLIARQEGGTLEELRDRLNAGFSSKNYLVYAVIIDGVIRIRGQAQYDGYTIILDYDGVISGYTTLNEGFSIGEVLSDGVRPNVACLLDRARTILLGCGVDVDEDTALIDISPNNDPGSIPDLPGDGGSGATPWVVEFVELPIADQAPVVNTGGDQIDLNGRPSIRETSYQWMLYDNDNGSLIDQTPFGPENQAIPSPLLILGNFDDPYVLRNQLWSELEKTPPDVGFAMAISGVDITISTPILNPGFCVGSQSLIVNYRIYMPDGETVIHEEFDAQNLFTVDLSSFVLPGQALNFWIHQEVSNLCGGTGKIDQRIIVSNQSSSVGDHDGDHDNDHE